MITQEDIDALKEITDLLDEADEIINDDPPKPEPKPAKYYSLD